MMDNEPQEIFFVLHVATAWVEPIVRRPRQILQDKI